MHIFLTGQVGVGKSTLIRRVLDSFPALTVGGFKTVTAADIPGAFGSVYILPAGTQALQGTDETRVGIRGTGKNTAFPAVFDCEGVRLLSQDPGDVLIMDELGVMENEARLFHQAVLSRLEESIPVLGVIKPKSAPLLNAVRAHPAVTLFTVTEENRDALLEDVKAHLALALGIQPEPAQEPDSCGVVVLEGSGPGARVLLVSTGQGRWSFPKGHREPGESEEETALREVFEETGIHSAIIPGFRMSVPSARAGDTRRIVFFLGRPTGGILRPLLSELADAGWFSAAEAGKMINFPQDRAVLQRALDFAT